MRSRNRQLILTVALLAVAAGPVAVRGASPGTAAKAPSPTPLADPASAAERLAKPAPAFVIPAPTGKIELAADGSRSRIEDKVSAGKPVTYLFKAPAGRMLTIGVSSPKQDVRMAIYRVGSDKPLGGAGPQDGTIRWTSELSEPTEFRLVAITDSPETPFRFEVSAGPGSM